MSACPSVETLRGAAVELLDEAAFAEIEEHLADCKDCQNRLETLAREWPDTRSRFCCSLPERGRPPQIPRFRIERQLGRGAMGIVYLAFDHELRREVALKVISGAFSPNDDARKRWRDEARAFSRVRHPNVVSLYDIGETDGWLFLVLEYIPGGSLKKRIDGPVPPRVAAKFMLRVSEAVEKIHQGGQFHLDLKPSNILIDSGEDAPLDQATPKVADFGIARPSPDGETADEEAATTVSGPWGGTPSYMAPEQVAASRDQLSPASDVHALGAILYQLVTGRPPFQGASTLETLEQVRSQDPVPPRRLNPKIPRDLETIALKCLEKSPSRRYASAEALAGDLRRWLDARPISARPVSPIGQAWRWCRRRPAVGALAAALMTTISVGFLAMVLLWRRADAERNRAEQEWSNAEKERDRAEAGYKAARAALAEVFDLGTTGLQTTGLSRDQFIVRLQTARRRILNRAEPRSGDLESSKLAYVDLVLGKKFEVQGKIDEPRLLHGESLLYWENILRKDPFDQFAQHRRFESAVRLATAIEDQGNAEDSLRHWERASLFGESILPAMSIGELETLADCRCSLATHVDRLGERVRARTILEGTLRILGNVPAENVTPEFCARVARTQFELGKIIQRFSLREIDHLSAEDWANRVARFFCSTFTTDSIPPLKESDVGCWLAQSLGQEAAFQRRNGKLDEAHRTVDRIHALGKIMVVRYPDQASAHLCLAETFAQRAKNAWRPEDRDEVERNWKLAIDEARHTLLLDPRDARAERLATKLQRRLNDLLAAPRETKSQGRTVQSASNTAL